MAEKTVIAVDLGASNGRVMQVGFDGKHLNLDEKHRFLNVPVQAKRLHWDVLRLWQDIQQGIRAVDAGAASVGVDTWGVDIALIDRNGELVANPTHYRDSYRNENAMEYVFERMPRREVFERTGIQFMTLNGIYELATLKRDNSPWLDITDKMLTIADLFNYFLSGSKTTEFTETTTTQLYNPKLGNWDEDLFKMLDVPTHILPEIVQPGTRIGDYEGIPVTAVACHDTACAVVAVPTTTENYAYLSSGTWSLLGLELKEAVINDGAYEANLTNEGGFDGTYRYLKNITGMWLVQQCKYTWADDGTDYDYAEMVKMAESAQAFQSFIEPDDPLFRPPGDMPSRIRQYCEQTGQPVPENDAQILRTVYESLALKYAYVLEHLVNSSGHAVDRLHVIGGGSKNDLLNQMTANAIGRPVLAGPAEGTAMGNAIVQLISLGELGSLSEARQMLNASLTLEEFQPQDISTWQAQYQRFKETVNIVM